VQLRAEHESALAEARLGAQSARVELEQSRAREAEWESERAALIAEGQARTRAEIERTRQAEAQRNAATERADDAARNAVLLGEGEGGEGERANEGYLGHREEGGRDKGKEGPPLPPWYVKCSHSFDCNYPDASSVKDKAGLPGSRRHRAKRRETEACGVPPLRICSIFSLKLSDRSPALSQPSAHDLKRANSCSCPAVPFDSSSPPRRPPSHAQEEARRQLTAEQQTTAELRATVTVGEEDEGEDEALGGVKRSRLPVSCDGPSASKTPSSATPPPLPPPHSFPAPPSCLSGATRRSHSVDKTLPRSR